MESFVLGIWKKVVKANKASCGYGSSLRLSVGSLLHLVQISLHCLP